MQAPSINAVSRDAVFQGSHGKGTWSRALDAGRICAEVQLVDRVSALHHQHDCRLVAADTPAPAHCQPSFPAALASDPKH